LYGGGSKKLPLLTNIKIFIVMKKEQGLGIMRHLLTFVGGILVMKGVVDEATFTEISGALLTVVGGIWSVLIKK